MVVPVPALCVTEAAVIVSAGVQSVQLTTVKAPKAVELPTLPVITTFPVPAVRLKV